MAASTLAMAASIWELGSPYRCLKPAKRLMSGRRFIFMTPKRSSATWMRIRASDSQPEESTSTTDETVFQEDLKFVLKVGGGSVVGAAVIKYGSIFLPEIARPNIYLALFMVLTPVIVAPLILIIQSAAKR